MEKKSKKNVIYLFFMNIDLRLIFPKSING